MLMKLTINSITPFLPSLKAREMTQTELAERLGTSAAYLNIYMKRKGLLAEYGPGTGGASSTAPTPEMQAAIDKVMSTPTTSVAQIARECKVDYHSLVNRVKRIKRRQEAEANKGKTTAEQAVERVRKARTELAEAEAALEALLNAVA